MSTTLPSTMVAGDFLNFVIEYENVAYVDKNGVTQYLSSTDSTLTYIFRNKDNRPEIKCLSTGSDYEFLANSTTTENWQPGLYYWAAVVTHATGATSLQWEIQRGTINVLDNFAKSAVIDWDGRSHVKKVLDGIESAIEGRADKATLDWISYSIAGRSRAIDPRELRTWYAQYKYLYQLELAETNPDYKKTGRILAELP